jgi:phosphoserine phosphatase RsbU/P
MLTIAPGRSRRFIWTAAAVLLVGGALFGYLAWHHAARAERQHTSALFTQLMSDRAVMLDRALRNVAGELTRASALLGMQPGMSREQFRLIVTDAFPAHPFVRAFEWAPLVVDASRLAHEASARGNGYPEYGIFEIDGDGAVAPRARQADYAPVFYVEPFAENRGALGFDLLSEPVRASALRAAVTHRAIVFSGVIDLVQESGDRRGVLMMAPVLLPAPHVDGTVPVAGFVLAVLRGQDLLEALSFRGSDGGLARVYFDLVDESEGARTIARSVGWETSAARPPDWSHTIETGGRIWRLSGQPTAVFQRAHRTRQPLMLGLAAFALWECLGIMVLALTFVSQRTVRRQAEDEARVWHQHVDEMYYVLEEAMLLSLTDRDGTILYVNDSFCRASGFSREELIGANHRICSSGHHPPEFFEDLWRTILAGHTWHGTICNRAKDGSTFWVDTSIVPLKGVSGAPERFLALRTDVSERVRHEASLLRLSNAIEQTADSIFITDCDGVIEYVNSGFELTTGYSREEAVGQTPVILKSGRQNAAYYEQLWATIKAGEVFRSKPINRRKDGREYHAEQTITPIRDRTGRLTHFVSVVKDVSERIRSHAREVEIGYAARVQQRLYPPQPHADDRLDLAAICLPATATGGDYFDFLTMPDGWLGIAIADVSGHGLPSALIMAETRAYLRPLTALYREPAVILDRMNPWLHGDLADSAHYVTLLLVALNAAADRLEYASGGHVPGCVLDSAGALRCLIGSTGVPLGMFPETTYRPGDEIPLEPGDVIVLLTDGVLEAEDQHGQTFGLEGTIRVVREHFAKPSQAIVRHVTDAVAAFAGGRALADDVTVVVCRIVGRPEAGAPSGGHDGGGSRGQPAAPPCPEV